MHKIVRFSALMLAALVLMSCVLPAVPASASSTYAPLNYAVYLDGTLVLSDTEPFTMRIDTQGGYLINSRTGVSYDFVYDGDGRFYGFSSGDNSPAEYVFGFSYDVPVNGRLFLYMLPGYTLTIDPAGGTWRGSSSIKEYYDCVYSDMDEIEDPVRIGYTFNGWSLIGAGSFDYTSGVGTYTYGHGNARLSANWISNSVPSQMYSNVIYIDPSGEQKSFIFSAESASPSVTVKVTSNGCVMTCGTDSRSWTYSGQGDFIGFATDPGGSVSCGVGDTVTFNGGVGTSYQYTLYPVSNVSSAMTATFMIDGKTYTFSGTVNSLPEVTMTVNNGVVVFSDGVTSYYHDFDSVNILGYMRSPASSDYIAIGESYVFRSNYAQGSYSAVLYPFRKTNATYSTLINIYNVDGSFLNQFVYNGVGASPDVSLSVLTHAIQVSSLIDGVSKQYSHPVLGREVVGLSEIKGGPVLYFTGSTYLLPGSFESDCSYTFYLNLSSTSSDSGSSDGGSSDPSSPGGVMGSFVAALINPVSAFFSIEFIPGFSFGRIALVAFLLGLLFWFLKAAKS